MSFVDTVQVSIEVRHTADDLANVLINCFFVFVFLLHLPLKMTASESHWLSTPPTKVILTDTDLQQFLSSPAHDSLLSFILSLNQSVQTPNGSAGVQSTCCRPLRECISLVLDMLDEMEWSIKEHPAQDHANSRFGNRVFREWLDSTAAITSKHLTQILTLNSNDDGQMIFSEELQSYLMNAFGDRNRIDYGTGHELHFVLFLMCLQRLSIVNEADHQALVLQVFTKYMHLMRTLQTEYWLEPAGSHGVWGLDDYHFLPFLFGSAQLCQHKYIKPKAIHDKDVVMEFADEYMYLSCINFVNKVKTESLAWHSPMLNDISGVKLWSKINSGLVKMYKNEVLGKLPIMQHLLFGRLFGSRGLNTLNDEQRSTFMSIVGASEDDQLWTPFEPTADQNNSCSHSHHHHHGHSAGPVASPIVQLQGSAGESQQEEVVVKYVSGPNGTQIPIMARRTVLTADLSPAETPVDVPQELYALGQQFPDCCGHRIPSAIAANALNSRPGMLPFD